MFYEMTTEVGHEGCLLAVCFSPLVAKLNSFSGSDVQETVHFMHIQDQERKQFIRGSLLISSLHYRLSVLMVVICSTWQSGGNPLIGRQEELDTFNPEW